MSNELGYIDKEPFKRIDTKKQDMIILNEKDDCLEIKVNGIDKYDSFEMFTNGPGKLVESKLYYGINRTFKAL